MTLNDTVFAPPPVYATPEDRRVLEALVREASDSAPGAGLLRQELQRLVLAREGAMRFVRLGDVVRYRDLRTKRERQVRLVRPEAAEPDENWISVLSPVGAALIGVCEGAVFRWVESGGRLRAVRLLEILRRPSA